MATQSTNSKSPHSTPPNPAGAGNDVTTAGPDRQPSTVTGEKKNPRDAEASPATPAQVAAATQKSDARQTPHDATPDATPPQHGT